jgi:arylsulfatase A-like enzyme
MGGITEIATSAPGYNSILPITCAPLARTLKLNGYATAQFGKCHEVPLWETSPAGPFDAWPTGGGGFEYFHDLLHTLVSWYVMYGGDLYELAKILRQSNIKMTERYTKLARQHIAKQQHEAGDVEVT